jgi:hypothetical protein
MMFPLFVPGADVNGNANVCPGGNRRREWGNVTGRLQNEDEEVYRALSQESGFAP